MVEELKLNDVLILSENLRGLMGSKNALSVRIQVVKASFPQLVKRCMLVLCFNKKYLFDILKEFTNIWIGQLHKHSLSEVNV